MKLVVVFAICLVAVNSNNVYIHNNGYYWRSWNLLDDIPADAVPGGMTSTGHKTYIAKAMYPNVGVMVPGEASYEDHKMRFEFDHQEHFGTIDVHILCSLSHHRFQWVTTKLGDHLPNVVRDNVLVFGAEDRNRYTVIGRKEIQRTIHIGKVIVDPVTNTFMQMRIAEDGKGYGISDNYQVLVYNQTYDSLDNVNVEFNN